MSRIERFAAVFLGIGVAVAIAGCGGGGNNGGGGGGGGTTTYVLTVNSTAPATGAGITVSPADNNGAGNGTTSFTRTYNQGTTVTLTAPATMSSNPFGSWTGCTTASAVTCTVTMNANTTVTANYTAAAITGITVTPTSAVTIGTSQQFAATVTGTGSFTSGVTWAVTPAASSTLSAGTITSSGLYQTPYPAPPTVTVTATSTFDTTKSGSATITLSPPATAAGPALTVDLGNQTRPISPLIYGMNNYLLDTNTVTTANLSISRWGGDATSRYNYETNTSNSASDYYFFNGTGSGGMWGDQTNSFNGFVSIAAMNGVKVLGTVPVQGWVANSAVGACSFPQADFPGQESYVNGCGNGNVPQGTDGCTSPNGCALNGDSGIPAGLTAAAVAALTSISAPPPTPPAANAVNKAWAQGTWTGGWVNELVTKFGPGNPASGNGSGVSFYDLDNEPSWWDAVHRDVHPVASTYDEVTNGGIGAALAIKTVDPTAMVNGPVVDFWWNYFYSKKDIESGWGSGPCFEPWQNPIDRNAHGGEPFIEYYLQQFAGAEKTYGARLLDYVVLHTYDAASYNGNSVAFTTAGDTGVQQARLNSTRAFWDPTYTDPNLPQPNYTTDGNYTANCSTPLQAPQLLPMMHGWVAKDYPGTKIAIDEYNWGGLESINGAVTQADILGIFGAYGLDLGTLWPTQDPSTQVPGTMAFAMYRNYDGAKSTFGDTALASTSANPAQLAVYGALRTKDGALTVMVINKTYGALTETLNLANLSANGQASVYQYSNGNLAAIQALPAVTVTAPAAGSTTSTLTTTFPAQSITLLVIPTK